MKRRINYEGELLTVFVTEVDEAVSSGMGFLFMKACTISTDPRFFHIEWSWPEPNPDWDRVIGVEENIFEIDDSMSLLYPETKPSAN